MKRYRCVWCGKVIPKKIVDAALARGMQPKYDTKTCRGNAHKALWRKRTGRN